jgi:hypothetical protein
VWNRQRFSKHPVTGKRVARPNPRTAWIVEPVPAQRIIEAALWSAVQRRLEAAREIVTGRRHDEIGAQAADQREALGGRLAAVRRPRGFSSLDWSGAAPAAVV